MEAARQRWSQPTALCFPFQGVNSRARLTSVRATFTRPRPPSSSSPAPSRSFALQSLNLVSIPLLSLASRTKPSFEAGRFLASVQNP